MSQQHSKTSIPIGLFSILLVIDVLVLLFEKIAALHAHALEGNDILFYISLLKTPWMWLGVGLGPFQLWVWTKILARTDLSLAYCVSSLSYPLTIITAQFLLKEHLSLPVWLGVLLITMGVIIVGGQKKHEPVPPIAHPHNT